MSGVELLHRLNEEWSTTAVGGQAVVERWAGRSPALAGCRTPGDVLARVAGAPDAVLSLLVGRAQAGEEDAQLAGRVVVQALLGKMVLLARADRRSGLDDYVAQLWCQVLRYPLQRRPRGVAANLWMDTRKAVRREQGEVVEPLLVSDDVLDHLWVLSQPPADVLSVRRVVAEALALGLVDELSAKVLVSVYADGLSSAEAGERHAMSTDLVRWRCSRARRRMAAAAERLVAA